uniref:Uncharacterized protein n=1 Tax=Globisporangium ultimum (strain ATCC 200006 / CBS 805.95 / DAOM BR144) TaxID=431595 RepID=K3WGU3_GLOUD
MTSFAMPVRQLSSNLLKRVRSASPAPELRSPAATETTDQFALKVSKHQLNASPRSSALQQQQRVVSIMTSSQRLSLQPLNVQEPSQTVSWPHVTSCDGVRNAITFLQTSRQHAMMLMLQNHWERAVGVLEKIEKATESVCLQRRKVVLEQVNAAKINASAIAPVRRSAVRFSDHVHVAAAVDMDRACDEIDAPVREEMLVLRASRTIPQENYSEFW